MAPDFISMYSPPFISLYLYFAFSYFFSTIIDFCIYSQPDVVLEYFSYTDSLINLKEFIATSVIRGNYSFNFRVVVFPCNC